MARNERAFLLVTSSNIFFERGQSPMQNGRKMTMVAEKPHKPKPEKDEKPDMVNHPAHYKTSSGLEAIDVIEAFTEDLSGAEAINTGNALKYLLRWKHKNGLEDLRKAKWYLKRLIKKVKKAEAKKNKQ